MANKPDVPYMSMPLGYQAVWILIMTILVVGKEVAQYGWQLPTSAGYISENIMVILLGAYFWGWV